MTSSKCNYLSKAPFPNAIPLGVRVSAYEFGGNTPPNCCCKASLANKLVGREVKESKAVPVCQDRL